MELLTWQYENKFISFYHRPDTGEIFIHDLFSHRNTRKYLENKGAWREANYLPDGTIWCHVEEGDIATVEECAEDIKKKYPSFQSFMSYCYHEIEHRENFVDKFVIENNTEEELRITLSQKATYIIYLKAEIKRLKNELEIANERADYEYDTGKPYSRFTEHS
jgi:hypothetical protein